MKAELQPAEVDPSFKKNTKNWYTIDALGAIFAIFTILDTFTKLLQYYYNTITILFPVLQKLTNIRATVKVLNEKFKFTDRGQWFVMQNGILNTEN